MSRLCSQRGMFFLQARVLQNKVSTARVYGGRLESSNRLDHYLRRIMNNIESPGHLGPGSADHRDHTACDIPVINCNNCNCTREGRLGCWPCQYCIALARTRSQTIACAQPHSSSLPTEFGGREPISRVNSLINC